jgi:hypothetical protein
MEPEVAASPSRRHSRKDVLHRGTAEGQRRENKNETTAGSSSALPRFRDYFLLRAKAPPPTGQAQTPAATQALCAIRAIRVIRRQNPSPGLPHLSPDRHNRRNARSPTMFARGPPPEGNSVASGLPSPLPADRTRVLGF